MCLVCVCVSLALARVVLVVFILIFAISDLASERATHTHTQCCPSHMPQTGTPHSLSLSLSVPLALSVSPSRTHFLPDLRCRFVICFGNINVTCLRANFCPLTSLCPRLPPSAPFSLSLSPLSLSCCLAPFHAVCPFTVSFLHSDMLSTSRNVIHSKLCDMHGPSRAAFAPSPISRPLFFSLSSCLPCPYFPLSCCCCFPLASFAFVFSPSNYFRPGFFPV